MTGYNLLWITLLLLAVHHSRRADSFQCYECEDCPTIKEGDLKYLKECVLPDNFIVRPTTTAAPVSEEEPKETEDISSELEQLPPSTLASSTTGSTTSATSTTSAVSTTPATSIQTSTNASTTTSAVTSTLSLATTSTSGANFTDLEETITFQNGTDSEEEEEFELSGNSAVLGDAVVKNTTEAGKQLTQTSAEASTTQKKKKASSWSLFSQSKEEFDSRSDELAVSREISQRSSRQLSATRPMCYVLTIKYDGFEVTNRGCGAVLPDRNLTCKMLSKGQAYSECGLCEGNKCNNASTLKIALVDFFFVVVLVAVHAW